MKTLKHILLATFVITFSCGKKSTSTNKENNPNDIGPIIITHEQFELNNFALGTLEKRSFPEIVRTTGMIDVPPENRASVNALMGGYIKNINLLVGDEVKKGQALAILENKEFITLQQDYLEVFNQLDFLRAAYERQKTLLKENITSEKNYLKAKSNYEIARTTYNGLRKKLELLNISSQAVEAQKITSQTTLYSPISGSLTKVNVNKGSFVSPSSTIMEVINNDEIHLELHVFEKDILLIKKSQPIRFRIPESSDNVYSGKVHLIGSSIDEKDRTIEVHGHLENDEKFLVGMFVEAEIIINSKEKLALPSEAIVETEGIYSILRLIEEKNGLYHFKNEVLDVGISNSGYTEIKNNTDFKLSDQFLVEGSFDVLGN